MSGESDLCLHWLLCSQRLSNQRKAEPNCVSWRPFATVLGAARLSCIDLLRLYNAFWCCSSNLASHEGVLRNIQLGIGDWTCTFCAFSKVWLIEFLTFYWSVPCAGFFFAFANLVYELCGWASRAMLSRQSVWRLPDRSKGLDDWNARWRCMKVLYKKLSRWSLQWPTGFDDITRNEH